MSDTTCPLCGTHDVASRPPGLTADGEIHRDMTCEDCGATWITVYHCVEIRHVHRAPPQEERR
jgi:transcriptional regulator NrdR family protein